MIKRARKSYIRLLVLVAICLLMQANPLAARAAHGCASSDPQTAWFSGYSNDVTTHQTPSDPTGNVSGTGANIRAETGAFCSGTDPNGNNQATWVMMVSPDIAGLAQVGYGMTNGGLTANFFYEAGATNDGTAVFWHPGQKAGETHTFKVAYQSSTICGGSLAHCFVFMIDGNSIATTRFDPVAAWGNPIAHPWGQQLLGESSNSQSDLPGRQSGGLASIFNSVTSQTWSTGSFGSGTCDMNPINTLATRYGLSDSSLKGCGAWSVYTLDGS